VCDTNVLAASLVSHVCVGACCLRFVRNCHVLLTVSLCSRRSIALHAMTVYFMCSFACSCVSSYVVCVLRPSGDDVPGGREAPHGSARLGPRSVHGTLRVGVRRRERGSRVSVGLPCGLGSWRRHASKLCRRSVVSLTQCACVRSNVCAARESRECARKRAAPRPTGGAAPRHARYTPVDVYRHR
jgi:hypothetical protein